MDVVQVDFEVIKILHRFKEVLEVEFIRFRVDLEETQVIHVGR